MVEFVLRKLTSRLLRAWCSFFHNLRKSQSWHLPLQRAQKHRSIADLPLTPKYHLAEAHARKLLESVRYVRFMADAKMCRSLSTVYRIAASPTTVADVPFNCLAQLVLAVVNTLHN